MTAEEAGTWFNFPPLSTLKSGWRPGQYLETITKIWNPALNENYRSKEDN